MWLVVYIAKGRSKAEQVLEKLEREGLMVRSRAMRGKPGSDEYFEIMALRSECEFAREILLKLGI